MRMTALIACVPLLAGPLGAQATTSDRLSGQGGRGLTLMLLPPSPETHQSLRYVLSEPAYVAAFLVYPGAGVRLLYPLVNQREKLHSSGYNSDELIGASFDNDSYNVVLGPNAQGNGPVYLYMVASKRPLDVSRYVHKPMTLASAVGENESRSFYSDVAFDALLNNAVSLGDDDSWDSDVYILWPSVDGSARGRTQLARVLCGDGTARDVPIDYPFSGCPGQQHVRPIAEVLRPVQRTAEADAQSASPSFANGPTVLPTIVGDRAAAAEQRAARARAGEGQAPMIITAANGDEAVAQAAPSAAAMGSQVELFERSGRAHDRGRRDDNGLRTPPSPEQRQEWRNRRSDGRVGGSPTLPPNPRLSPNPGLPPNPGFSPNPGMGEHQRSAPRFETPRPMGSSPPPVRSAPSVGQLPAPSKGSSKPAQQDH